MGKETRDLEKENEPKQVDRFETLRVYPSGKVEYFKKGDWHEKAQRKTTNGYLKFGHKEKVDGKWVCHTFLSHRIVAQAFLDNTDNKPYVNHINGVKTDNRLSNLEWCTPIENNRHAIKIGLSKSWEGEKNYKAKLTWQQVIEVRALYGGGFMTKKQLSEKYNILVDSINCIIKRKKWINV